MPAEDETTRDRVLVALLATWVPYVTASTVVIGMAAGESAIPVLGVLVVVFAVAFPALARLLAGPGWSRFARSGTPPGTWSLVWSGVITWLGLMIGILGSRVAGADPPALVLVGLLASLPLVVAVVVRRRWWRSLVGARRERPDDGPA